MIEFEVVKHSRVLVSCLALSAAGCALAGDSSEEQSFDTARQGVVTVTRLEAESGTYSNPVAGGNLGFEPCSDGYNPGGRGTGCGQNMGWIDSGDWVQWSYNAPATGSYKLDVRAAANLGDGTFNVLVDGALVQSGVRIPNQNGWQNYVTVSTGAFDMTAGAHTVRLQFTSGNQNLNYVEVVSPDVPAGGNLFVNPTFASSVSGWQTEMHLAGDSLIHSSVDGGVGYVQLSNGGTSVWQAQVRQVFSADGSVYTMSFAARTAGASRNVELVCELNGSPYTQWGPTGQSSGATTTATIDGTWRTLSHSCKPPSGSSVRFSLRAGGSNVGFYIDNASLTKAAPPPPPPPPPPDSSYVVAWEDDFGASSTASDVDRNKWVVENNAATTKGEKQVFRDLSAQPASDRTAFNQNGQLHLVAKYLPFADGTHVSSSLYARSTQKYGRIAARVRLPMKRYGDFGKPAGTFPAFWSLGSSLYRGTAQWPACGEIDFMEHVDLVEWTRSSAHNAVRNGENSLHADFVNQPALNTNTWFLYGVDWTSEYINYYAVKDPNQSANTSIGSHSALWSSTAFHSVRKSDKPASATLSAWWPYDAEFTVLFNFSIGGSWVDYEHRTRTGATPDYASVCNDPNSSSYGEKGCEMLVDWVRVEKLSSCSNCTTGRLW